MAAGPPRYINNVIEIVLHATQEGSQRANVFHYQKLLAGPPSSAQLLELATNWWNAIQAAYTQIANSNLNFDYVTARDISAPGLNEATYVIPQPHIGTAAGVALPANAAAVISWKTGQAGRSNRGRTYLFGLSDGHASGSTLTSTYLGLAALVALNIRSFNNAAGAVQVVFAIASFTHGYYVIVTSATIDAFVDSQRRRLIGRGG